MLRATTFRIISVMVMFLSRQRRRVHRVTHRLPIQCYGGGLCGMRQVTRCVCVRAGRPVICLLKSARSWKSMLMVVAFMSVGFLLVLSFNVPTQITFREIQITLPPLELPPDTNLKKVVDNDNYNKEEGQGVPEREMIAPVDPLFEKGEPENLMAVLRPNASRCQYQDLRKALAEIIDGTHVFVMVIPDVGHVDMAKNTLQTIERWTKKRNLLFVCRDVRQCEATKEHGLSCFLDESLPGSSAPVFKILANILEMDYTPIYMDFESSLTKALPYLPSGHIDMVTPYGNTMHAHSFFISLNTPGTLHFHKTAILEAERNVNKSFAAVFKSVLNVIQKGKQTFKLAKLPQCTKFPMDPDCSVTRHPKFYSPADRTLWLKDKQLWYSDINGYYSDPKTLYISYENNFDMGNRTIAFAVHALQNALAYGSILNRIVILPKFFCPQCVHGKCKLNNCLLSQFINMTRFDGVFGNCYREHSFRGHPLVPVGTKKSTSEVFLVSNYLQKGMMKAGGVQLPPNVPVNKIIMPNDMSKGPDSDEVLDLFEDYATKYKILVFVNLYGAFSGFTSAKDSLEFEMKLKKGIELTNT